MSTGANLENSSLRWLMELEKLRATNTNATNRVLQVSALEMLDDLRSSYSKAIRSEGRTNTASAQQQYARANNIAQQVGDLVGPAAKKTILDRMRKDLSSAQKLGQAAGLDLDRILKDRPKILDKNAQPNKPAINAAGIRLDDFWARENTMFRDRVRAMTQLALAEGKSWRQLSLQVRELLQLEKAQGTESRRSQRVNRTTGGISRRAELIAQTEMATAYTQGEIAQYRNLGYEWARWIAGGERTCGYCLARDGLVYRLEEIEGMIPAHPRCRCDVGPVDPPPGHKKGQPKEGQPVTPEEAARHLDDQHWAKSRQRKLDEWKQQQNNKYNPQTQQWDLPKTGNGAKLKSNSELDQAIRDFARTPTNTQAYLQPGVPAPAPMWAPSGQTIPDPSKAAQAAVDAEASAAAKRKAQAEAEKAAAEQQKRAEQQAQKELAEADQWWPAVEKASGGAIPKTAWDKMSHKDKAASHQNAVKQNQSVAAAQKKAAADAKALKTAKAKVADDDMWAQVSAYTKGNMTKAQWDALGPASKQFWMNKATAPAATPAKPLSKMTAAELKAQAKAQGLDKTYALSKLKKGDLLQLLQANPPKPQAVGKPAPQPTAGKARPVAQQKPSPAAAAKAAGDRFMPNGDLMLGGAKYTPGATLAGSTNPQLFMGPSGKARVVKGGGAKGQNVAENTAQQVMRELNPNSAINSQLVDGKLVNEYLSKGTTVGSRANHLGTTWSKVPGVAKKLKESAATDALLANWDVVGLSADNLMINGAKLQKIDAGGTFNFRAQGGAKNYGGVPIEMVTLRRPGGQLRELYKGNNAKDLEDLWGRQSAQIVGKAPELLKIVNGSQLPPAVKKAFSDRLEVFKGLNDTFGAASMQSALKSGKVNWQQLDKAASAVLEQLAGLKKLPSNLRQDVGLRMVNELSNVLKGTSSTSATTPTPKKPAPKAQAQPKTPTAFKKPKPADLEGHSIGLQSVNTQADFVGKWTKNLNANGYKQLGVSATSKAIMQQAIKNEQSYYAGREVIGPALKGKDIKDLKALVQSTGQSYAGMNTKEDLLKALYITEATGKNWTWQQPAKKPSDLLGIKTPGAQVDPVAANTNSNGQLLSHPSDPTGVKVMRGHAEPVPGVTDEGLRDRLGLTNYHGGAAGTSDRVQKTAGEGGQMSPLVQSADDAKRRKLSGTTSAVRAWSNTDYDEMRSWQYADKLSKGWQLNKFGRMKAGEADLWDTPISNKVKNAEKYIANTPKYDGLVMRDVGFPTMDGLKDALTEYISGKPVPAMESWARQRGDYSASHQNRLRLITRNKHGASMEELSSYTSEYEVLMPSGVRYKLKDGGTVRTYMEGSIQVFEVEVEQL